MKTIPLLILALQMGVAGVLVALVGRRLHTLWLEHRGRVKRDL